LPATGSLLHCLLCRPDAFGPLACLEHLPWCKCEQWRCKRAKKGARMEHDLTRAETMAPLMLKHDGKPNRWCSVQEDVEDYFRKTFGEVRAACRRLVLLVHMGLMLSAAVLRDAIMTASVLPVWRVCCAANHDHRWCNEHCHIAIQAPGERALVSCLASHRPPNRGSTCVGIPLTRATFSQEEDFCGSETFNDDPSGPRVNVCK
jgi:hypothetical protein